MSKYEYRESNEGVQLGDQEDLWLVYKDEEGDESQAALCSTEHLAASVTNLLNGLLQNIAAIATNFRVSDAYNAAIDGEWESNGWAGLMERIVGFAQVFTEHEPEPHEFDWYLAIDEYTDLIVAGVLAQQDMFLSDEVLTRFAEEAIRNNSHVNNADDEDEVVDEDDDEVELVQPHFESIKNNNPQSVFSHFEIQTAREYYGTGDGPYTEVVNEPVDENDGEGGPVMYSVYGRYDPEKKEGFGGVQCIGDFGSLEKAREFVVELNGPTPA